LLYRYDSIRHVFGEGNCYYRAVFFGACELHLKRGNYKALHSIHKQLQGVASGINSRNQHQLEHNGMVAVVQRLSEKRSPYDNVQGILSGADAVVALAKFTTEHEWFDAAVVRACKRLLVQDILHKHNNNITNDGNTMALLCDRARYGTVEQVST
jgi:Peptidase C65 Otubain